MGQGAQGAGRPLANLGATVNAAASQSSLQLALENEKLKDAQAAYLRR